MATMLIVLGLLYPTYGGATALFVAVQEALWGPLDMHPRDSGIGRPLRLGSAWPVTLWRAFNGDPL